MMKKFLISGLVILLAFAGLAKAETYMVQPGDVLFVSVWKEQDLQRALLVRPDGGISFPLVGDVDTSNKSVDDLRREIAGKLEKYIPDAQVDVALQELNGNRIYVVGKVNRPGVFPFSQPVDVLQALGMAGGATPFAELNNIKILRRENGKLKAFDFKFDEVKKARNLEQNIMLESADTVVVP